MPAVIISLTLKICGRLILKTAAVAAPLCRAEESTQRVCCRKRQLYKNNSQVFIIIRTLNNNIFILFRHSLCRSLNSKSIIDKTDEGGDRYVDRVLLLLLCISCLQTKPISTGSSSSSDSLIVGQGADKVQHLIRDQQPQLIAEGVLPQFATILSEIFFKET